MNPYWTFFYGLLLLILFGWYFATDIAARKRVLGSVLTVLLIAFCLETIYPPEKTINLGMDLKGGTSFLIRLVPEGGKRIDANLLDQAVEVIRKRVDSLGVAEPVITPQGEDRILVQIAGLDPARIAAAREQLQKVARLEFRLVHPQSDALIPQIAQGAAITPPGYRVETMIEQLPGPGNRTREEKILVRVRPDLGGERVASAYPTYDTRGYGVGLQFDSRGGEEFGKLTAEHVNERFAIVLDGVVQSAPVIREPIYGGHASITGRFSEKEARDLASVLENPLAAPVVIEEERSASATLGLDSIKSGVYAGVGGLILTLLFVAVYYRFPGLVALAGLMVNIVLLFGAMSMFGFVLTLPGIAGIVLTIGMAVDANVLIYERLREEMAAGKSLGAAIEAAYEKAFSAIFDSNATTLITSVILFWLATGPVKGFAVTLTIGVLMSVFCAMVVTRNLFDWVLAGNLIRRISMMDLIRGRSFDFLGKRRLCLTVSALALAGSVAVFAVRGERNFGVDFRGGDLVMLTSERPPEPAAVRAALAEVGLGEAVIQREVDRATGKELLMVRSPFNTSERVVAQLAAKMPEAGFKELQRDKVGKLVGGELARTSLIALGLGMLGILVFVTLRFEFSFALGAIVALLHDVVITVGIFSAAGRELSLIMVGAILTIAGYSINDTIVVFDRIREGLRSARKGSVEEIMNASINETLSRTVLTSGSTLLTLCTLYFFGGPVLRDFAFAILVGILVGTYSSIFIASPIVLWWARRKGRSLDREVRETEEARARIRGATA